MKWQRTPRNLLTHSHSRIFKSVFYSGLTAILGITALLAVHATSASVSLEPETATLASGARVVTSASASGSGTVLFASAATPPPSAGFGSSVLITPARIVQLKAVVANHTEPNYTAWLQVLSRANAAIGRTPNAPALWFVPDRYTDPAGEYAANALLKNDANDTYALALAYQITGNAGYATQAVKFINSWSTVTQFSPSDKTQTKLSWCDYFPAMIFGADMLRSSPQFSSVQQTAFSALVTRSLGKMSLAYGHTAAYTSANATTYTFINNQDGWGLVFETSAAAYLKDQSRFNNGVTRYRVIQDAALDASSVPVAEVRRQGGGQGDGSSGLGYANFALMAMTYSAEVMNVQGVNVYDYVSPSGGNLHAAYKKVAGWSADPATFVYNTSGTVTPFHPAQHAGYYEIMNGRWPDSNAQAILNANRPVISEFSMIGQTFVYGGSMGIPLP